MTTLMWMFALVEEYLPPLIAVAAMLFIELVPAKIALSGFSSRIFVLLLVVFALASAVVASGLAYRFTLWMLLRLPETPFWHRCTLSSFGMVLSIVMPSSTGRLAFLMPLYREMGSSVETQPDHSAQASGLLLATLGGATLFSPLLVTAKASNLAVLAMLPSQVRLHFQGVAWLMGAGVVALGFLILHFATMRWAGQVKHPHKLPKQRLRQQLDLLGPIQAQEWIAATAFGVFILGSVPLQWYL